MTKKEILVVEDEMYVREALEESLKYAGYAVTAVDDGEPAWELLREKGTFYNTVIFDRMMPKLGGMELLKRMKKDARFKNIPVILQTAMSAKHDIIEGLNAGAYYYLPKPYELKQLLAVVNAAILKNNEYLNLRHQLEKSESTMNSLSLLHKGSLEFQLQTRDDVMTLSTLLSYTCPDREDGKRLLFELLMNAVEHGNVGITYQDKTHLLLEDHLISEVDRRGTLEEYRFKKVKLQLSRTDQQLQFRIEDEGEGFDWRPYLDFAMDDRAFHSHGRGIAICNHDTGFTLHYEGKGNIVTATFTYP